MPTYVEVTIDPSGNILLCARWISSWERTPRSRPWEPDSRLGSQEIFRHLYLQLILNRLHKSPILASALGHKNPFYIFTPYFFKTYCNITLWSTGTSPKISLLENLE
jgi:hypothetical protein